MRDVRNGIIIATVLVCTTWLALSRYSFEELQRLAYIRFNHLTGSAVLCAPLEDGKHLACPPPPRAN